MKFHTVVLFASWLLDVCIAYDVHKHMTVEELRNIFHVDHHDLVPEYEVVRIDHVNKRSILKSKNFTQNVINVDEKFKPNYTTPQTIDATRQLRLQAFGRPFNLSLIPTSGLFKKGKLKIWTVEPNATSQHGVEYIELPETNEEIGDLYQDEENQAAVLLRNEEDIIVVEGSIGPDLVIRPIPARLRNKILKTYANNKSEEVPYNPSDDEMFLDTDGELSAEVSIDTGVPIKRKKIHKLHHIVYKKKKDRQDETFSDYAFMEPDHLTKRHKRSVSRSSRSKREAPYTIYPEILVIVDYDGYRLHGGDNLQIKRYFVSFWNGVDLRYKLLKGPKIRISIAGIIISRGRDATPYLERNRVGRDAIDSAAALTDMGKYLFRERRLPVYDIAVAITKYDMCRRRKGGRCTKGTAGFAYVGGACVVNKRLEKVNSVAIIEDTGGFSGIIVAAHEVGHLLGAVHDGSPPPSYLGGPGAEKCQWTDGYIMSDLRHTERGFRWSSCSVASFHHFLNGDTATCLYNSPHEDDSLPRVLPGKLLTLDAQCRRDRGTSACFKDDRVCAQLFCFDAGSGYCVAYRPAAEGSPCGDGQYCLNGRCVAEHENIIPDYSQNSATYVRSNSNLGRPLFHEDDEEIEGYQKPEQPQYYNYNTSPQPPINPYYQFNNFDDPNNYNQNYYSSSMDPSFVPTKKNGEFPSTIKRFNLFTLSTTKSPYDFKNFGKFPTQQSFADKFNLRNFLFPKSTTTNPYLGNFYQLRKLTTINPYNFSNFGRTTKSPYALNLDEINNNYLKRNAASYFPSDSNIMNNFTAFT
ncbi:A disintegrin and metalloproteinase with thrombospondin motifs 16 isoform X2 [Coccinella septempunctata]|uniref:A disintegrin and metalloproteinase with thrombospondin motifs 16 isoform X2 n=1 Tax=Coccinella septempunctata TaxID=41139 RepID=UPI001D07B8BF|nr:A disintegrin and metalloproteinase with thrombospondin motifs 16 isoform X2 [Coccinella septempunctata]